MIPVELWEKIDAVVYGIYHAGGITDLRLELLRTIGNVVPHEAAFFDLKSKRRGKVICFDPVSLDMTKDDLDAYYTEFIDKDYTAWATSQSESISAYRDSDFISDAARKNSELYKKWLRPRDVLYGCCINIVYDGIDYGSVCFGRSEASGDFTDTDIEVLKVIARHLDQKFHQLHPAGIPYPAQQARESGLQGALHLTDREAEICQLIYEGLTTRETASVLSISGNTLNRHLANIYKKTSVNNRVSLLHKIRTVLETADPT